LSTQEGIHNDDYTVMDCCHGLTQILTDGGDSEVSLSYKLHCQDSHAWSIYSKHISLTRRMFEEGAYEGIS